MAIQTLITLNDVNLAFGHHDLLHKANFSIQEQECVGLIGRNGAGKSSLLKILDGRIEADEGEVARMNGLKAVTVEQEPTLNDAATIFDTLTEGMVEAEDWSRSARANALIEKLKLDPQAIIAGLSGGTKKRIALARGFLQEPHLLLLDEPTNHLDFEGIAWLEAMIKQYRGACIVITHDRKFLDTVTTRIVELDRGLLHSFPGNFSQWQERKTAWLEAEALKNARFDKFLAQEEVWIRKGIEARRTRNEGRVKRLEQLRRERAARRERVGNVNFAIDAGERSGKLVAELQHINHSFGEKNIINDYSTTIMRGDRIGIIGPNGVGKTTLIKIILGQLKPTSGTVKQGVNLNIAYFDQMREQLDESAPLTDVINPGSEWVEIGQQKKHVMSYLGDFLFSPARAQSPVSSLSGGERARLLLARLFARPANVLVMDEPTNDLDIETLELLENLLQEFEGTVLLVSHDRTFLDHVITQTIAYEGNATWHDYVGGFDDWLRQCSTSVSTHGPSEKSSTPSNPKSSLAERPSRPRKLGQREQKELAEIPDRIAILEEEQTKLTEQLSNPDLYINGNYLAQDIQNKIAQLDQQIVQLMERWELLESRSQD